MSNYRFAIRDTSDGAIHTSRFTCLDDAMSACEDIAYAMELEPSELEVVEMVERVNSSITTQHNTNGRYYNEN